MGINVKKATNKNNPKVKQKKKHIKHKNSKLSCSEIESLMRQDSYTRGPGGALRQKTWGK